MMSIYFIPRKVRVVLWIWAVIVTVVGAVITTVSLYEMLIGLSGDVSPQSIDGADITGLVSATVGFTKFALSIVIISCIMAPALLIAFAPFIIVTIIYSVRNNKKIKKGDSNE